jgi:cytochrome P450
MKSVQEKIKAAEAENKEHKFRPITKEEIMHQLISFYFAGIDTTGHLIAMAFYATAEFK